MDYDIYLGTDAVSRGIQISELFVMMQDVNEDITKLPLKELSLVTILSLHMSRAIIFFCLFQMLNLESSEGKIEDSVQGREIETEAIIQN